MKKKVIRKTEIVSFFYFFVVGALCVVAHNWAFSEAATYRAQYSIYGAIGGEILVVPFILVGALIIWVKIIGKKLEEEYQEVCDALEALKSDCTKEFLIVRNNKVIRVYKKRGKKIVCYKNPKRNNLLDRIAH